MKYTECVELHYNDLSISADVEMENGAAQGLCRILLQTDYTADIYIHPADLNKATTAELFKQAEKQHDAFMEENIK